MPDDGVDKSLALPAAIFVNNATAFMTLDSNTVRLVFTENLNTGDAAIFRCSVIMPLETFRQLGEMVDSVVERYETLTHGSTPGSALN
jgi:hypothetical protein